MIELVNPHVTMFSKKVAPSGKNGKKKLTSDRPSSKSADETFEFDSVHSC